MKLLKKAAFVTRHFSRCLSSEATAANTAITSQQNEVFDQEKERQLALVKRVEKIQVDYVGPNDACRLVMNKYLSTPYNVAMHLNQTYLRRSAIAMVNGKPWHMLQPLTEDCKLQFVTLKDDDVTEVNQAFWKSCSLMMGAILQSAFKDDITVELARAPDIPISVGCFAYDFNLPFKWEPTRQELICLNRQAFMMVERAVNFERLEVSREVAHRIFEDNAYKKYQLEHTEADRVVLFRLGDFVDIADGPLVTNTTFIGPHRYVFTCIHSIDDYLKPMNKLLRFQGVALPAQFRVHHTRWSLLEERARKPVLVDSAPNLKSSHNQEQAQGDAAS
ncbi:39S ribosomal protein L39, mitochondrial-like [Acanthaster planci]|uniref:39S ribosomal protein L39, mitochondrial-like n=1 Tax=Acanthaster planci TaxID=133434 RepID=A0A8B7YWL5_ACAPL|nr:39S ribosomal protein L39, mitochondrial-like [Acanthaster planci]